MQGELGLIGVLIHPGELILSRDPPATQPQPAIGPWAWPLLKVTIWLPVVDVAVEVTLLVGVRVDIVRVVVAVRLLVHVVVT